jgi:hypothetical protein
LPHPSKATTSHAVLPRSMAIVLICIGSPPASLLGHQGPVRHRRGGPSYYPRSAQILRFRCQTVTFDRSRPAPVARNRGAKRPPPAR